MSFSRTDREMLQAIGRDLKVVKKTLAQLVTIGETVAHELDDVEREVRETRDVQESAITLIEGLAQKVREAGTDPARLRALAAELDNSAQRLAAAVTANTPAEDSAEPPADAEPSAGGEATA